MGIAYRLLSVYLLLMALAVGLNYLITPFYDDGSTGFPVWAAFNWPMGVATVIAFAVSARHWRRQGRPAADGPGVKEWLQANVRFYLSLILLLWFLNSWFDDLLDTGSGSLWNYVNVMFVAITLSAGLQLWRDGQGE